MLAGAHVVRASMVSVASSSAARAGGDGSELAKKPSQAPAEAHGSSQLTQPCSLLARDFDRAREASFRLRDLDQHVSRRNRATCILSRIDPKRRKATEPWSSIVPMPRVEATPARRGGRRATSRLAPAAPSVAAGGASSGGAGSSRSGSGFGVAVRIERVGGIRSFRARLRIRHVFEQRR